MNQISFITGEPVSDERVVFEEIQIMMAEREGGILAYYSLLIRLKNDRRWSERKINNLLNKLHRKGSIMIVMNLPDRRVTHITGLSTEQ